MSGPSVAMRHGDTIDSILLTSARRYASRCALACGEIELGYDELDASVDRMAERIAESASMRALRGMRVAVLAPNVPALVIGLLACWRIGCVAVPLNARLRDRELSQVLEDCEPRVVVSVRSYLGYSFEHLVARLAPKVQSLRAHLLVDVNGGVEEEVRGAAEPRAVEPLDTRVATLLYTSGSTGAPKGAMCGHRREVESAPDLAAVLDLTEDDRSIFVVPVSHAFGLSCLLAALSSGGTAVLVDSTVSVGPALTAIERHGATVVHGAPAFFASLRNASGGGLPPSVRTGFVAGALPPPELFESLERSGARILNLYGLTETGAVASCRLDDPLDLRAASASKVLPGIELRVADDGEVQARGAHVTAGYHRRPKETERAFDGGWFRTGDLGELGNGRLRIRGRKKELVHVSGFNVFPVEVESALLAHPDVAQACVLGVPDETTGEALRAFVVLHAGSEASRGSLLQFLRQRIAGYKVPYALTIIPELPLLVSGKPDLQALRLLSEER